MPKILFNIQSEFRNPLYPTFYTSPTGENTDHPYTHSFPLFCKHTPEPPAPRIFLEFQLGERIDPQGGQPRKKDIIEYLGKKGSLA